MMILYEVASLEQTVDSLAFNKTLKTIATSLFLF